MTTWSVERLDVGSAPEAIPALVDILIDCVEGGASVSFLSPVSRQRAGDFWKGVCQSAARDERALLVARDGDGAIQGTVQLILSQPENQPHRADVAKLLVHRRVRRGGAGELLMREVERVAVAEGKSLLVLDTASDDANRLYRRLGWTECGRIPGYALNPDRTPCDTVVFWKSLS